MIEKHKCCLTQRGHLCFCIILYTVAVLFNYSYVFTLPDWYIFFCHLLGPSCTFVLVLPFSRAVSCSFHFPLCPPPLLHVRLFLCIWHFPVILCSCTYWYLFSGHIWNISFCVCLVLLLVCLPLSLYGDPKGTLGKMSKWTFWKTLSLIFMILVTRQYPLKAQWANYTSRLNYECFASILTPRKRIKKLPLKTSH